MISLKILFIIFLTFVILDKGITAYNIVQVNKNFPEAMKDDKYKIERNPLAKFFFNKMGVLGGSIAYGLLSLFTLFAAFYLLKTGFHESTSLYLLFMLYGFTIFNNLYFAFKYSALIP